MRSGCIVGSFRDVSEVLMIFDVVCMIVIPILVNLS